MSLFDERLISVRMPVPFKMATGRRSLALGETSQSENEAGRELFEACRNGDLSKVKKLVSPQSVNAKDTTGRRSSPLHFAAGKHQTPYLSHLHNNI